MLICIFNYFLFSGGGFTSKRGVFGKHGKPITMLCGVYGNKEEQCFTGGADGKVYEWTKTACVHALDAHTGPVFIIEPAEKVHVYVCSINVCNIVYLLICYYIYIFIIL